MNQNTINKKNKSIQNIKDKWNPFNLYADIDIVANKSDKDNKYKTSRDFNMHLINDGVGDILKEGLKSIRGKNSSPIKDNQKFKYNENYKFEISKDRKSDFGNIVIDKETYIQRNLFINRQRYIKKIGTLIGFETSLAHYDKKGGGRLIPVDLISYNYENQKLTINIIELKRCKLETPDGVVKESNELLIRAIFEVETYAAYFRDAYLNDGGFLKKALMNAVKKLNKNVPDFVFDNLTIRKIILGPEEMIDERNNKFMKPFINDDVILLILKENGTFHHVEDEGELFSIL